MNVDLWFLDDIRDAVNSPGTADPDLLREASIAYHDACRDANTRLRDVDRLLKKGFRNEAIQLAEQEPVLLDLVADLDFSLLEEWQGMLAQWGMQLPPQLERDIAARLNAAYAELQPLEYLMRQHRLLALARAPLFARIEVLRKINALDLLNLSWKTDLVAYERQRLQQIRGEAGDAGRRGDLATLSDLRDELTKSVWLCEVPQDVLGEVEGLYRSSTVKIAREMLGQLAPELDRAYSEFDVTQATELADRWSQLVQAAVLDASDPLAQQAREALEWVQQQRQAAADQQAFQASLHAIDTALDRQTSLNQLESLYHKAERFELPIPDRLRKRVADRLDVLRLQSRRRGLLIGVVASIVVAVATGGVFLYWRTAQGRDLVAQHVERLTQLVEQEQWTQADAYYAKLPLTLQQVPELITLHTTSTQGIRTEGERAEMVAQLLDRAEKMDPAAPDHELLGQITQEARTADEKQRLAVVELEVRAEKQERQQTLDEAFLATVNKWSDKISELERRASLDNVDLWALLAGLQAELRQHSQVTASLRIRGEPLASKLRAIIDQKDKFASEHKALQAVFNAFGRPADYLAALEKLVQSQPNSTAASHARQVLDDQQAWQSVIEWAAFWEAQRAAWPKLSPQQAAEVLRTGDELLSRTLKNDLGRALDDRKDHLATIVARKEVDLSKLKLHIIQNPLTNGVWLVSDTEGKRFYCPKRPEEDASKMQLSIKYFTDYSKTTARTISTRNVKYNEESPQSVCAKVFAEKLAALNDENWDNTFYDLAAEVRKRVEHEPSLDEVLAMDMLRRILTAGSAGSYRFKEAFSPVIEEIENSGVDLSVAWFAPGDKDAEAARGEARAVIRGLTDFTTLVKNTRDLQMAHCQPPTDQIAWVAALDRRRDDKWVCQPPLPRSTNGSLLVVTKSTSGEASLTPVAEVRSGEVKWISSISPTVQLIGTPVFLKQNTGNKP